MEGGGVTTAGQQSSNYPVTFSWTFSDAFGSLFFGPPKNLGTLQIREGFFWAKSWGDKFLIRVKNKSPSSPPPPPLHHRGLIISFGGLHRRVKRKCITQETIQRILGLWRSSVVRASACRPPVWSSPGKLKKNITKKDEDSLRFKVALLLRLRFFSFERGNKV